ncbi:MAG: FAD-binding oxidoreductase [Halobacteriales archaeon]
MDPIERVLEAVDLAADQVDASDGARASHAQDVGTREAEAVEPDVVVYPETTGDVATVLRAASEAGVPVTPFAAGTSLEGNPVPVEGGISLDMRRMDAVLDVRPEAFQLDVEPGVMGPGIEEALAPHGLFFPPLPSSGDISTIGGMVANDASGMQTVKYGEVRDWVLGLEVILADGTVITTGGRAAKSSCGYNLTELFVGSEGTLGVITRVTLEAAPRPEQIRGGRVRFEHLDDATAAVADLVQSGVDLAKVELMDEQSATIANAYLGTDLPDEPMVFLEFHAEHHVEAEIDFARTVLADHAPTAIEIGDETDMDELWRARRELAFAMFAYDPDLEPLHPGDVTVPIDRYAEAIAHIKGLADAHDFLIPCFGHGGDGNVHYAVMVDPSDEARLAEAEAVSDAIVAYAIDVGGTATGEHGVGRGKQAYLLAEHGPDAVATMRAIKDALDPAGILNPGKIFPPDQS